MNLKRTFGGILTVLGIIGLIYTAVMFTQGNGELKSMLVFGILGFIFFIYGVSLVRTTKDEA